MASSVSILNNYDPALFTFGNKELLMQGLLMKQGRYDLNKGRLNQLEDQMRSIDVIKDSDKDYLNRRLAEADNVLRNSIQNGDLSNEYLVDQLISKFDEIVDEPIKNAIISSKTIRAEEAEWERKRADNDGSYSDINYTVSSYGRNKYLADDRVGVKYSGGGGFTPFYDMDKKLASKEFNEYLKSAGINAEYIVAEDGVGSFRALNTMEGTTDPERLKAAISSFIGEDGRRQMGINAIYKYGYGDTQESVDALRAEYNSRISNYSEKVTDRISSINEYLKNTSISADDRAKKEEELRQLEANLEANESNDFDASVIDENGFINENKFLNIANKTYSANKLDELFDLTYMSPIFKDRKIDDVQYKTFTYNEDVRQFNIDSAIKQARLNLDQQKYELDLVKEGLEVDPNTGQLVKSSGGTTNLDNISLGAPRILTDEEIPDQTITKDVVKSINTAVKGLYDSEGKDWTYSNTSELMRQLASSEGFSEGQTFNLGGGKSIKVTPENILYIQQLEDVAKGNSTTAGKTTSLIAETLGLDVNNGNKSSKGAIDWAKIATDSDKDRNNIMLVKDKTTGKFFPKEGKLVGAKGDMSNLKYLGWKITNHGWDSLSENEKATADYYKVKIFQAGLAQRKTNGVGTDTASDESYLAQRMLNQKLGSNVLGLAKIEKNIETRDIMESRVPTTVSQGMRTLGMHTQAGYLDQMTSNARLSDGYGSFKGVINEDYIDRSNFQVYNEKKDIIFNETRAFMSRSEITVSPTVKTSGSVKNLESQQYQKVKSSVGLPTEYKGNIYLKPIVSGGKVTNEFSIEYDDIVKKDGATTYNRKAWKEQTLTLEKATELGLNIHIPQETPYNASLPTAPSVKILPTTGFKTTVAPGAKGASAGTPAYYSKEVRSGFDALQQTIRTAKNDPNFDIYKEIQSDNNLLNPTVTLVPSHENKTYLAVFGAGDNATVFGNPLGKDVSTERVAEARINADNYILSGMITYLQNKHNINF